MYVDRHVQCRYTCINGDKDSLPALEYLPYYLFLCIEVEQKMDKNAIYIHIVW